MRLAGLFLCSKRQQLFPRVNKVELSWRADDGYSTGMVLCPVVGSLVVSFQPIKLKDNNWEGLGDDVASLHRLKGLASHFKHLQTTAQSDGAAPRFNKKTQSEGCVEALKFERNKMDMNDSAVIIGTRIGFNPENGSDVSVCMLQKIKDVNEFLKIIEGQKTHDVLLSASETSHTYRNKLILIMDGEAETLQLAEKEYSEDPWFSVKAEISCLQSNTCPSDIGRGTVIKIFGRLSEDGNTLSGFSGSSLALLMLKPEFQDVSLFSTHRNTSTIFRNGFLRVYKAHDISAVLETTTQNNLIYQTLDSSGAAVEYQVTKRPVDHSTQYDGQHILILQDDRIVRDAATFLYEKHPTVSSVYMLENGKPKLIKGDPTPLTAESRLVIVGHGRTGPDGKTTLGGYKAKDVAEIITHMNIDGDQIKTTSVVGCDVGSDEDFVKTLLKELHAKSINTELHLRNTLVQVTRSGQKITGEITPDGIIWKNKDGSKKLVGKLDRNSEVVIQTQSGYAGQEVYPDKTDVLGKYFTDTWPSEPKRFVDQVFRKNKQHIDDIEALAWAFFNEQATEYKKTLVDILPKVKKLNNIEYVMYKRNIMTKEYTLLNNKNAILDILDTCYELHSGKDIVNVIKHYAIAGEKYPAYFMQNDWVFQVHPKTLYVYPVGKKLKPNEDAAVIKQSIEQQMGKHQYRQIREGMNNNKKAYSKYFLQTLKGTYRRTFLHPYIEAWFGTYLMASVISETIRNFRSFPVTLMALDMSHNPDNNIAERGQEILFDKLPMTKGGTWSDVSKRGFDGVASTTSKWDKLDIGQIVKEEDSICSKWLSSLGQNNVDSEGLKRLFELVHTDVSNAETAYKYFKTAYKVFKTAINKQGPQLTSGVLGGSPDGQITVQDMHSAAEVEHSLKLSSYYSRSSAELAQHIHNELQRTFGEKLQELSVKPNSIMVKDGEFHCQFVNNKNPQETTDWEVKVPAESQHQMEKIWNKMEKVSEPLPTHETSGHLEREGMAVGTVGLILGAKAAVQAFEEGDIKHGIVNTLQTVHGVTGMSLAAVGKRVSVAAEGKVIKAVSTFLKNPVTKHTLKVMPIIGISFGVYSIYEDIKRGDALGYIDAGLDSLILALDIVELAQPHLTPVIMPISLALNIIRMVFDDIYLGVQDELNKLPPNAGILNKIGAVIRGFSNGLRHDVFDVASFFYTIPYREIENGRTLVDQISDYHKYYSYREVQSGRKAIDFTGGESSWNGGGICFSLSEQGPSEMCLDSFVSADESFGKRCWPVDTADDIVLGTGESHKLQYSRIQRKVLLFIPAGSITVVSGYQNLSYSRYGKYSGNSRLNNFFAVQKNEDSHLMEIMLSYYYELNGNAGGDTFYLGPQRSYVKGQGGRDTYIIPKDGGNTHIDNYDPLKTTDLLILGVNYDQISVSKSEDDVTMMYLGDHSVRIIKWFVGEEYRHINMMSEDGIMFDISTNVLFPVKLTARAVNLMSKSQGQTVDTTLPHLLTVTNVLGSTYNDRIIGNAQNNMLDGGGGRDYIKGGEGEDVYIVNEKNTFKVEIDNNSTDKAKDMIIIEADLHTFRTKVSGNNLILMPFRNRNVEVTLKNWFRSEENRHLLVVTKDLITFSLSAEQSRCSQPDPLRSKCILSQSIDYSKSSSPLVVDLQDDEAFQNVTEVRGSNRNDRIKGNSVSNTIIPGAGSDLLEGRGGQDVYVVTPGQGTKVIFNYSPDLELDTLLLNEVYERIVPKCFGQDIKLFVNNKEEIQLKSWFSSETSQHLMIRSSDGITFLLPSSSSQCGGLLKIPQSVDYRNANPGQTMKMNTRKFLSVVEMYGSSGFDIMTGNDRDNWLDPFTGGAILTGGEGKDTYLIKPDYGTLVEIDNFALDEKEDTVQFQAEFLGNNFTVYSENYDVILSVHEKGQNMKVTLKKYGKGNKFQHLNFQTADGVHFRVMSPVTNQSEVFEEPWIKAYKVVLKGQQSDCHIDLRSQTNLLTVHTVQGCPHQSNHIQASDIDNAVFGGLMDDVLDGGNGHDTLIGGKGNDILIGGAGNDTLYGEDGDDTLLGGPGWDIFVPGPGADVIDGGSGRDTVLYTGDHKTGTGVYVNLLSGEGHLSDAEGDVLKDVENVIGTIYPDILVSGYEPTLLKGSDGDDVLVSLSEGDVLIGGDGRDVYMMVPHHGWITIDNCAEDSATDMLYLPTVSLNTAECKQTSSGLMLNFHTEDDTFVGIFLKNWVNTTHDCGHLTLILREGIASVETLQQNC
ncbi:uncharacterized protein LOC125802883 [Astyanax mexicanus]|uniref:uncharacterized protein LOC125802883 n=1 Tax=Astyanax mexicanus TaxID=7994 RepID=UPI0020CB63D5|nr:uncharacterized protein LOC125802883 [Astyanax mexicanus]